MTQHIAITLDQLLRRHAGGIGTYVRGLLSGFGDLSVDEAADLSLHGVAPRGRLDLHVPIPITRTMLNASLTTRAWQYIPLGIPRYADVVHATSLAGPFAGGRTSAVHSVLVHDVLWRDFPELSTAHGTAFHEHRLQMIRRADVRILVTTNAMRDRLASDGFAIDRIHVVRLGVRVQRLAATDVASRLSDLGPRFGFDPNDPFTLCVSTVEPRKNIERLIQAHALARREEPTLGPLVLVGARGWGTVDTSGALHLGPRDPATTDTLIAACRVFAYVPISEGWGLPAVEALGAGRPVVTSADVPSVADNDSVVRADARSVDDIASALVQALHESDDDAQRERRRQSVSHLTWANCARDHVAAWR